MKFKPQKNPTIDQIIKAYKSNNKVPKKEEDMLNKAYKFALDYHVGQKRKSGESYIVHPMMTGLYLAELGMDYKTICAGVLHDVPEDTNCDIEEIRKEFGKEIADIVEGVTRLSGVKYFSKKGKAEDLRKLLLVMAKDIRVVAVKLIDRLHNLQTLYALPSEKQKRVSKETIEIYAPLASRLGIGELKGMLEDLSFKYYIPEEYKRMVTLIGKERERKEKTINRIIKEVGQKVKKSGIKVIKIEGRVKHIYSFYKKLKKYNNDFSKINDLIAIRLIVPSIGDCYEALGVIHNDWRPLIQRIKDYIAVPKPNGYRSLHTTVFASGGEIVEIQIKTEKMHEEAEWGVAAHWHYKESKSSKKISEKFGWIKQLIAWQKDIEASAFMEGLQFDIFRDRIFVFTPQGEAIDLPEEATTIDFAYAVHTEVGNSCIGAKVNGRIAPLSTRLNNGDVVEILTSKNPPGPSKDWLRFAKTSNTLQSIRRSLRIESASKNIELGKEILNAGLKKIGRSVEQMSKKDIERFTLNSTYKNLDHILSAIGGGYLSAKRVVKDVYFSEEKVKESSGFLEKIIPILKQDPKIESRVVVEGEEGIKTNLASCCIPKPSQEIVGFITRGKGVTIHRKNCSNIRNQKKNRIVNAFWVGERFYNSSFYIEAEKNADILAHLSFIFSRNKVKIRNINLKTEKVLKVFAELMFFKNEQLKEVMEKISELPEVILVKRLK